MLDLLFNDDNNKGITFLVTSNQMKQDSFLEDINNLLNSGEIPNLYCIEELDEILGKIKEHMKKHSNEQFT